MPTSEPVRLPEPDAPHAAESTPGDANAPSRADVRHRRWLRWGVALVILSMLLWLPLPFVPFLSLSVERRLGIAGGLFIGAELTFWAGAALAGPELFSRVRAAIRGLRGRSDGPGSG